jgi:hypothetical protein
VNSIPLYLLFKSTTRYLSADHTSVESWKSLWQHWPPYASCSYVCRASWPCQSSLLDIMVQYWPNLLSYTPVNGVSHSPVAKEACASVSVGKNSTLSPSLSSLKNFQIHFYRPPELVGFSKAGWCWTLLELRKDKIKGGHEYVALSSKSVLTC